MLNKLLQVRTKYSISKSLKGCFRIWLTQLIYKDIKICYQGKVTLLKASDIKNDKRTKKKRD